MCGSVQWKLSRNWKKLGCYDVNELCDKVNRCKRLQWEHGHHCATVASILKPQDSHHSKHFINSFKEGFTLILFLDAAFLFIYFNLKKNCDMWDGRNGRVLGWQHQ